MTTVQFIFYACSVLLIGSALTVITAKNSVKAVMFLILSFFFAACLWMLLEAEFLAILLVLVYIGAVMVLFLFVVMMLDINFAELREGFTRYLPVAVAVSAIMMYLLYQILGEALSSEAFPIPDPRPEGYSNIETLGMLLYTEYFYAFITAALILMVAMIAAISLAFRGKRQGTKTQAVDKQVKVKKEDRLRIISMPAEKKEGGDAS
jgi:NADH-quinone oxidoreductase subunit J